MTRIWRGRRARSPWGRPRTIGTPPGEQLARNLTDAGAGAAVSTNDLELHAGSFCRACPLSTHGRSVPSEEQPIRHLFVDEIVLIGHTLEACVAEDLPKHIGERRDPRSWTRWRVRLPAQDASSPAPNLLPCKRRSFLRPAAHPGRGRRRSESGHASFQASWRAGRKCPPSR